MNLNKNIKAAHARAALIFLLIQETFYAFLGGFLELLVVYFHVGDLAVCRECFVYLLFILFHDGGNHLVRIFVIGVDCLEIRVD